MLTALRVGNLALVEEIEVRPGAGLTMLTGETGAGKSLIAGALGLLAGGRVEKGQVRRGAEMAYVEGVFDLGERPDDLRACAEAGVRVGGDGIVVLRREIPAEGRGRTLINGLISSQALLEQLGGRLLSIQSQDQQRQLSRAAFAGEFLDRAAGLQEELQLMAEILDEHRRLERRVQERRQEAEFAREQLEMWQYQHRELQEAGLDEDEFGSLAEQIALGRNARQLVDAAASCRESLSEGEWNAVRLLGSAESQLAPLAGSSPRLEAVLGMIRDAAANAAEAASDLERFLDGLELDPARLDELEERDALYRDLMRKYDTDVGGLIDRERTLADRIGRQQTADGDLRAMEEELEAIRMRVEQQALALHRKRCAAAPDLARRARDLIRPLALPELELEFRVEAVRSEDGWIELEGVPCRVGPRGADRVTLLVRTNRGEMPGEVGRIASGGERSRIHLGLSVLATPDEGTPLLLFDEIDAGLGMDNAVPVADLLARLSRRQQVLCITHLPTVACRGDAHWRVVKAVRRGRTSLAIEAIEGEERVRETARLLGGDLAASPGSADVSESQIEYARRLLEGRWRAEAG